MLRAMRSDVAWIATGHRRPARSRRRCAMSRERQQFGRPLGSFQLVQEKLGPDARQRDLVAVPGGPADRTAGPRASTATQDSALAKMQTSPADARDRGAGPRGGRRQRHHAGEPTSRVSTPTPRPSTPTRAPTKSTPSSSAAPSPAKAPSPADPTAEPAPSSTQTSTGAHHDQPSSTYADSPASPAPTSATPTGSRSPRTTSNLFADATDDHQWIHVDPERADGRPVRRPDRPRLPHPLAHHEVLVASCSTSTASPRRSTTGSTRSASSPRSRSARGCG